MDYNAETNWYWLLYYLHCRIQIIMNSLWITTLRLIGTGYCPTYTVGFGLNTPLKKKNKLINILTCVPSWLSVKDLSDLQVPP